MAVAPEPEENNNSIIVVGLVLAVLLPIVGLIIGLTQINKRNGILVVIVSVLAFATWFMILQEQFGGTDPVPYTY